MTRRNFLQRLSGVSLAAVLGGLLVARQVEATPEWTLKGANGDLAFKVLDAQGQATGWTLTSTLNPDGTSRETRFYGPGEELPDIPPEAVRSYRIAAPRVDAVLLARRSRP